jgi:hypothetical protein
MPISQTSPFQSLPRELRDQIYKFSLPRDDPSDMSTWLHVKPRKDPFAAQLLENSKYSLGNSDTRAIENFVLDKKNEIQRSSLQIFPLPPICFASKTTYNEVVPLVLQCSTIYCLSADTTQYLFDWLAEFPHTDGYGSIRSLAIEYGMIDTRESEVLARSRQQSLLGKCTNLRYLTLVFRRLFNDLVFWEYENLTSIPIDKLYGEASNIVKAYQFEEVVAIPMLEKLVLDFSSALGETQYMIPEHLNNWYVGRWKEEERAVALECKPADFTHYYGEERDFFNLPAHYI